MTAKESRLVVNENDGITKIEFLDRNILEEANIQHIGDEISELIDQSTNPRLMLNFANVEHLSSAALGTLITIDKKVKKLGGQLRLSNIDPQIYEVFVITKLNKLFQIHDTEESAMASFK
ncbi:STAS domain-containing protein [Poriferisphaera sp. WC338]|uniref:STAS domain-containing protein n=1 Tax=Poriferisphaera sp. WC338 TaxID=3425129 RepID=UPI003D8188C4